MIADKTYKEAVEKRRDEIGNIAYDVLDDAKHITIQEAMLSVEDESERHHAELVALPCRLLGVLVLAEQAGILTYDQMQELYSYVEVAGGEYLEKRSAC